MPFGVVSSLRGVGMLLAGTLLGHFCVAPALAGSFLKPGQVTVTDLASALFSELEATFRPSAKKERLGQLEEALRNMYTSLPKEQDGNIGHTTVRYALHRLFLQRHGWFVKGLEPSPGGAVAIDATSEPTTLGDSLSGHIPEYLQGILEKRQKHTVDLRDLAIIAATLEDLIHKEAIGRLEQVYEVMGLLKDGTNETTSINEQVANEVLERYLMVYLVGGNMSAASAGEFRNKMSSFKKRYADWDQVEKWLRTVQKEVFYLDSLEGKGKKSDEFDFRAITHVVEALGERFGTFNDGECSDLKSQLIEMEGPKAGRVLLADFYNRSMHSHWKFTEKVEYMRKLGALDESDKSQTHVLISNYIASRPNCLEASSFYEVCCRNECEDLMGDLERKIAQSEADPAVIVDLVSKLTSASVKESRTLTSTLRGRLYEISVVHGGKVPLHGRLFAQWMHHAFPRECPYPHDDMTNPQTPDEWMAANGHSSTQASNDEISKHVASQNAKVAVAVDEDGKADLPWTLNERLLVPKPDFFHASTTHSDRSLPSCAPIFFGLLLVAGLALLWSSGSFPQKRVGSWPIVAGVIIVVLVAYFCDLLHEELFIGVFAGGIFVAGLYKVAIQHTQLQGGPPKVCEDDDYEMKMKFV